MIERRVVVTSDADFLEMHFGGIPHAGIVYVPDGHGGIGRLVNFLILLDECLTAEEMAGQVQFA